MLSILQHLASLSGTFHEFSIPYDVLKGKSRDKVEEACAVHAESPSEVKWRIDWQKHSFVFNNFWLSVLLIYTLRDCREVSILPIF